MQLEKKIFRRNNGGGRGRKPFFTFTVIEGFGGSNRRRYKLLLKQRNKRVIEQKQDTKIHVFKTHIYLDTENLELAREFYDHFKNVIDKEGLEVKKEEDEKLGSWIMDALVGSKDEEAREVAESRLVEVLRKFRNIAFESPFNHEDDEIYKLVKAYDVPNFVIMIGQILLLKVTNDVNSEYLFLKLNIEEYFLLIKNESHLLDLPKELFQKMKIKFAPEVIKEAITQKKAAE